MPAYRIVVPVLPKIESTGPVGRGAKISTSTAPT
jgi:hypothetical protein